MIKSMLKITWWYAGILCPGVGHDARNPIDRISWHRSPKIKRHYQLRSTWGKVAHTKIPQTWTSEHKVLETIMIRKREEITPSKLQQGWCKEESTETSKLNITLTAQRAAYREATPETFEKPCWASYIIAFNSFPSSTTCKRNHHRGPRFRWNQSQERTQT